MARAQLDIPDEAFIWKQDPIRLQASQINAGFHLSSDKVATLIFDARNEFWTAMGVDEYGRDGGPFVIVTDQVLVHLAEGWLGDELVVEAGVHDLNRRGGDCVFRITRPSDGTTIAIAKTGFVFLDQHTRKITDPPASFTARFGELPR